MIILTLDEVIEIHERLITATGGSKGIRDINLLESAIMGCYQSFGEKELYPTIVEKAARMAYAICKNHPFVDGNKRTAVTSMFVILRMNNISLSYTQRELIVLGLEIAGGEVTYDDVVTWIRVHMV